MVSGNGRGRELETLKKGDASSEGRRHLEKTHKATLCHTDKEVAFKTMKTILHIDMNSYFASVEQQANPRLRGKPVGVTGGDREVRTVLCTASIEAKKRGVKTGMQVWEARKVCPEIIIVPGDSDKYLTCTTKFLNIFKDYTPYLEVFSIDECFLQCDGVSECQSIRIAHEIKQRLRVELGERITCSIGISYNKLMAKLAGSLQKPDGLVVIPDQETALRVLDQAELDDVCGIGPRMKKRLFNLGIRDFKTLRKTPKEYLLASFKSYGEVLYNMARGIDHTPIKPFYEKEEVKSIGHRYTIDHDTKDPAEIRQILLKMSEMVAARLRKKRMTGKTIHCWYRSAFQPGAEMVFHGDGMQKTLKNYTTDGLEIFQGGWEIFHQIWDGEKIRMIGVAISNLKPFKPANLSWLPEVNRQEKILQTLDKVNGKFGDFTLMRGILLDSCSMKRKPNPFLSDRRFKI